MWKRANTRTPQPYSPSNHGWLLKESKYDIHWFTCSPLPADLQARIVADLKKEWKMNQTMM